MNVDSISSSIGAVVTDLDLADLNDQSFAEIRGLLGRHGVLVFPGQQLDDSSQLAFATRWAPPEPHPVRQLLGVDDVLEVVENDAEKPPQPITNRWFGLHTDYTFAERIAEVAVLRADVVPPTGGATLWATTTGAYDALDPVMQERLDGLTAWHDLGEKFLFEMERTMGPELAQRIAEGMPAVQHPVVITHPHTGRKALFVNPGYTRSVDGMDPAESSELLEELFDLMAQPRFAVRWHWSVGDVAMWDEFATVHGGPDDFFPHERRLRRITAGRLAPSA